MPFNMKKGGGTANADTPGAFSTSDSNTLNTLKVKAFQDPGAPKGFKADAEGVTGTVVKVSSDPVSFEDAGYGIKPPKVRDIKGKEIPGAGRQIFSKAKSFIGKDLSKFFKGGKFLSIEIDK